MRASGPTRWLREILRFVAGPAVPQPPITGALSGELSLVARVDPGARVHPNLGTPGVPPEQCPHMSLSGGACPPCLRNCPVGPGALTGPFYHDRGSSCGAERWWRLGRSLVKGLRPDPCRETPRSSGRGARPLGVRPETQPAGNCFRLCKPPKLRGRLHPPLGGPGTRRFLAALSALSGRAERASRRSAKLPCPLPGVPNRAGSSRARPARIESAEVLLPPCT